MTIDGPSLAALPSWVRDVPFAHRGLHGAGVPENSLPAFEAACLAGVGIELDVRCTADGVAVVCHDPSLRRITGHDFAVAAVTQEVLAGLQLLGSSEPLPTLAQALAVIDRRVPVMVEVKNETARVGRVESATAAVLSDATGPLIVASFNSRSVRWFARNAAGILRAQTGGADAAVPRAMRWALRASIRRGIAVADVLSWNVDLLDDPIVVAARAASVPVVAWTVNDPTRLQMARSGADNLIFEALSPEEARGQAPVTGRG